MAFLQLENGPLVPFPQAPGEVRFLVVAIDYFTKWIEAEALASITSARIQKFFYRNIISRFGIPHSVVTDNGTQFTDRKFRALLEGLRIKQHFSSVEHPQTNGQDEAANKVILQGLLKRCSDSGGNWVEQLDHVLWAIRTSPQSSTGETPFRLTYGTEAVIPVEIGEPSYRVAHLNHESNERLLRGALDLCEEKREAVQVKTAAAKEKIARKYNARVVHRSFAPGSLVLRKASVGGRNAAEGKLAANWEGPYRVTRALGSGAYKLETLAGEPIPRTWNASNLRQYYS